MPPCTTDLFVLVCSDRDELRFGERLAADHLLDASNLHDVYPRLVFVQRIQHDLWGGEKSQHYNKLQDYIVLFLDSSGGVTVKRHKSNVIFLSFS